MKPIRKIKDFRQREDGSLLIFFVVSIVAILGIMALSFDMGRRASTQSDMQSFADNVALAAAGELDGQPDSITRATAAAQSAIIAANEQLKAGASGSATTLQIAPVSAALPQGGLVFYSTLPATDAPGNYTVASLGATKYDLPAAGITSNPTAAAFVGVRLTEVPCRLDVRQHLRNRPDDQHGYRRRRGCRKLGVHLRYRACDVLPAHAIERIGRADTPRLLLPGRQCSCGVSGGTRNGIPDSSVFWTSTD